jgi:hypothetical protein
MLYAAGLTGGSSAQLQHTRSSSLSSFPKMAARSYLWSRDEAAKSFSSLAAADTDGEHFQTGKEEAEEAAAAAANS